MTEIEIIDEVIQAYLLEHPDSDPSRVAKAWAHVRAAADSYEWECIENEY